MIYNCKISTCMRSCLYVSIFSVLSQFVATFFSIVQYSASVCDTSKCHQQPTSNTTRPHWSWVGLFLLAWGCCSYSWCRKGHRYCMDSTWSEGYQRLAKAIGREACQSSHLLRVPVSCARCEGYVSSIFQSIYAPFKLHWLRCSCLLRHVTFPIFLFGFCRRRRSWTNWFLTSAVPYVCMTMSDQEVLAWRGPWIKTMSPIPTTTSEVVHADLLCTFDWELYSSMSAQQVLRHYIVVRDTWSPELLKAN